VSDMEGINNQNQNSSESQTVQEEIMNRVNQTFDKISQDVKSMINDNNQHSNLQ
jgi:hypothetical protein